MKNLNWLLIATMAAGATMMTVSCSSNKKGETADTDSTAVETVAPAPQDSLTAIFTDPSKASEAATDSTYATTATGLKYMIVREGAGVSPTAEDVVEVHYEGKLVDGTVFDSSYTRGEPATFPLNRVIPGWTEGLQLMKEGGKAIFYIPSELGYGPAGAGDVIPPNANLIFTVELLKVVK